MSTILPCLIRSVVGTELRSIRLGHPVLDDYLEFVGARARPNTLLAAAFDLKVFFSVVAKEPAAVTTADVFAFIKAQRAPRRGPRVVRLEDGEAGLSARTIKRRLATVSGLFDYLVGPRRRRRAAQPGAPRAGRAPGRHRPARRGVPLIRTPRTLPRVLLPAEVDALLAALRTHRDRAMVEAMLLGGLRRCEVLGLRLGDVKAGERRLFIAEGKGGHQRIVPVSPRFFATLAALPGHRTARGSGHRPGLRRAQGPEPGRAAVGRGLDEIVARRPPARRDRSPDLSPAAPHLSDPAAGGRDGAGGGPGPGRAPLDRVDPHLPASGQRLAGRGVRRRAGRRDRRPDRRSRAAAPTAALTAAPTAGRSADLVAALRRPHCAPHRPGGRVDGRDRPQ